MSAYKPLQIDEVLHRLRLATQSENDAQLARALDIPQTTVSSWKKRGVIPYEACVRVAGERGISLDVLIFGDILPRDTGITPIHPELFDISWNLARAMMAVDDCNLIKSRAVEIYNARASTVERMRGRMTVEEWIHEFKVTDSVYISDNHKRR